MTFTVATTVQQRPSRIQIGQLDPQTVRPSFKNPHQAGLVKTRSFEIAGLRTDGSLFIGQGRAPALPLFDSAFAAFARRTLIQTTDGETAIEDLQPGDMINTTSGEPARLIWIGSSSFFPIETGRRIPLISIMPGSFGQSRPNSALTVGPGARILHTPPRLRSETNAAGMLTPLSELLDGVSVFEVAPPTPVRLFHICLERHAVIHAGGIEMETFCPDANDFRLLPNSLQSRFLSMFPQISHIADFGPSAHRRAPAPNPELRFA